MTFRDALKEFEPNQLFIFMPKEKGNKVYMKTAFMLQKELEKSNMQKMLKKKGFSIKEDGIHQKRDNIVFTKWSAATKQQKKAAVSTGISAQVFN